MCLGKIRKTGLNESGFGWKVFNVIDNKIYSLLYNKKKSIPLNKWQKAKRVKLCSFFDDSSYASGFHINLAKSMTRGWSGKTMKVKYRKGHTLGSQTGRVIVADEMLILPKKKERSK